MNANSTQARAAVRLTAADLEAIDTITTAMSHPLRSKPTTSEVIRSALTTFARSVRSSGLPQ